MSDRSGEPPADATTLTPEQYQRLLEAVDVAAARPGDSRQGVLEHLCGSDSQLFKEALALLKVRETLEPSDRLHPGTRIGPYKIDGELGRGGMGAVYLASRADQAFEKQVAIKVMRPDACDEDSIARFQLEVQILANLEHPNIARLIDAGVTEDGRPFIIMERVNGLPLTDYADRYRMTVRHRLHLFLGVCDAVDLAHRHRIIHRDLKPTNILVAGDGTPKLLDFGIAKLLTPGGQDASNLTATSLTPGTPVYASPEQLRGDAVDERSDVYQLGVVLAELLTGARPFVGGGDGTSRSVAQPSDIVLWQSQGRLGDSKAASTRSIAALAAARRTTPRKLARQVRGDIDAVVMRALRGDRTERYESVRHLKADLQRHLSGRRVEARVPVARRVRSFVVRPVFASGVVLSVLVALTVPSAYRWFSGRPSAEAESAAPISSTNGTADAPSSVTSAASRGTAPAPEQAVTPRSSRTPLVEPPVSAAVSAATRLGDRGFPGTGTPAMPGTSTDRTTKPDPARTAAPPPTPGPIDVARTGGLPPGLGGAGTALVSPPQTPLPASDTVKPDNATARGQSPAPGDASRVQAAVEQSRAPAPPRDPREAILERLRAVRQAYADRNVNAPELARHPEKSALDRNLKTASRVHIAFDPQAAHIQLRTDGTAVVVSPWSSAFFEFAAAQKKERVLGAEAQRMVRFTLRQFPDQGWQVIGWRWE